MESKAMFTWVKEESSEYYDKYVLNVADLYRGYVELRRFESAEPYWMAFYVVGSHRESIVGKGVGIEEGMMWVEDKIRKSIHQLHSINKFTVREVLEK